MEQRFCDQLPPPARDLVNEIEAAISGSVELHHRPELGAHFLARPTMEAGRHRAIIEYGESIDTTSETYPVPFQALVHELLHCKRFLVERVPYVHFPSLQPVGLTGGERDTSAIVDGLPWSDGVLASQLEHTVIERRLPQYGFPMPNYDGMGGWWTHYSDWRNPTPIMMRWGHLLFALLTDFLVSDPGIRSRAEITLRRVGLLESARRLCEAVRWCLTDPDPVRGVQGTAIAFCAHVGIPANRVRLEYLWCDRPGFVRRTGLPSEVAIQAEKGTLRLKCRA